jgi:putative colanic acid biosynthesis UDP-glucose lipid carrier transferase
MAWVGVFLILFVFAAATKSSLMFSREWAALWFGLGWGFLAFFRGCLRFLLRWMRAAGFNTRRIVLVGSGDLSALVDRRVKQAAWAGLKILGFFDDRKTRHSLKGELPHLGDFAAINNYIKGHAVDQVWLALPLRAENTMKRVLHNLRHATVDIRFVPDIFGFSLLNHSIGEVAGMPVVNLTASPMTGVNRVVKEVEDRVLAAVILALISPLLVLIALGVKLSSPGPILFKQARHGWDGKLIKVFKFRTMRIHVEPSGRVTQASRRDPRITAFGALLRRTSLDELPQFFNVLLGDMSIVGPRPHAVEHNEAYKEFVDRYMLRHRVKPGITGWAQINGYRGETDTMHKMEKRIQHDLYYIENWSLWFDLRIVLLSLFKGFSNQNAY